MVGSRFDFHKTPVGQKGGIMLYPASGVVSGCEISAAAKGGSNNIARITLSAGIVKFDGTKQNQPLTTVDITLDASINLTTATLDIPIFLNPTRKVITVLKGAAVPAIVTDGKYIEVLDMGDYYVVNKIYQEENGVWRLMDAFKDVKQGYYGWNNMPLNEINTSVALSASNFSNKVEFPIFHNTNMPPHVMQPSKALLRQTASIQLGVVRYASNAGQVLSTTPITSYIN